MTTSILSTTLLVILLWVVIKQSQASNKVCGGQHTGHNKLTVRDMIHIAMASGVFGIVLAGLKHSDWITAMGFLIAWTISCAVVIKLMNRKKEID